MKFNVKINDKEILAEAIEEDGFIILNFSDRQCRVEYNNLDDRVLSILIDGRYYTVNLQGSDGQYDSVINGRSFKIELEEEWKARFSKGLGFDKKSSICQIKSPMPGKIVRINVKEGDAVKKGQGVIVVEAMKMENELCSPVPGVVEKINVTVGETAGMQEVLMVISPK